MNERALQLLRGERLPSYLADLAVLTGRVVSVDELLSLDQTAAIRLRTGALPQLPAHKWLGPFSTLAGPGFAAMLARFRAANAAPILLWPSRADDCGALRLASLSDVNFGFAFAAFPPGMFGIVTDDAQDKLVLDFYEDDAGPNLLEVQTFGAHWGSVVLEECLGQSMRMGF